MKTNQKLTAGSLFLWCLIVTGITTHVHAQTNVLPTTGNVGIGTTSPTSRLQVNGSAKIDSSLTVKDSVLIQRKLKVQEDVKFLGDFVVQGLTKLNGDFKLTSIPVANNYSDLIFLVANQNGLVKKATGEDLNNALKSIIYAPPADPAGPSPISICDLPGYTDNPTWINGPQKLFVECPQVRVGIGTAAPSHSLTVIGDSKFGLHGWFHNTLSVGADDNGYSKLFVRNEHRGSGIEISSVGNTNEFVKMIYMEYSEPSTEILKVQNPVLNYTPFLLTAGGMMAVHNGTIETLRLEASGLLRARKIKVDTEVWPDYVFDPEYRLMPLNELENYILVHKHLPNVPSQEEIQQNGIDVGDMNVMLMEKVEELTRYLLQQQQEIEALKKQIQELQ